MTSEPSSPRGAGDPAVEVTPLQLIRWIDTSPDLGYLREAADQVKGRFDVGTGQINFQSPDVDTVIRLGDIPRPSLLVIFSIPKIIFL